MSDNDENHLIAERRAKLARLRERGNAFPNDFRRDALAADLLTAYGDKSAEALDAAPIRVKVAGRMRAKRVMGKASFARLEDSSGAIQVFLQSQALGEVYDEFKGWDVGDVIGAEGTLFRTKTNELSVRVERLLLLTKSLRPLPDKWHGIADTELRYRRRYVDLIMNEDSRRVFETRSSDSALSARLSRCPRISRSGNADAAPHPRRCRGASLQDASQCAGRGHVPSHRAGAVSEAAHRRRLRAGVRDQPQFPQRRSVDAAQP